MPPTPQSDDRPTHSGRHMWLAAVGTWLAILAPSVATVAARREVGPTEAAFLGALLLFGALLVLITGPWEHASVQRSPQPWTAAAVACAVAATLLAPLLGPVPVLFILTAVIAAHTLRPAHAYGLVAFQTGVTAFATVVLTSDLMVSAVQSVAIGGFQVFAVTTTITMLGERSLRQRLAAANAELRATRALLRETSKLAERSRISRDLHDLVGHHLTALNLQLEVASHVAVGPAVAPIDRSRAVARLLLADVRSVVSDLRTTGDLDVERVLRELVVDLPRPRVHLDVGPGIALDDLDRAQVVVRCVQEAITNAIRHADADNVWITLTLDGDAIDVRARDDGVGSGSLRIGNGLRGMRERLAEIGGRLDVSTAPGDGFLVRALVPVRGARTRAGAT